MLLFIIYYISETGFAKIALSYIEYVLQWPISNTIICHIIASLFFCYVLFNFLMHLRA